MRILIDIIHPAHVHFFKHSIWEWERRGHKVIITSRDKDLTVYLLNKYGFINHNISRAGKGTLGLAKELFIRSRKLFGIVKRMRPNIMIGIGGTFIAPLGRLIGIPVVVVTDTENATVSNFISFPCCNLIVTPTCFNKPIAQSSKRISYNGYQSLSHLHPNYFTPDPSIHSLLGVKPGEKYVIVRFVGWSAGHDLGHKGMALDMKIKAVNEFSRHARVFITSEKRLPSELEAYRITIPPEKIHHAMYYATLLYGESSTMASECSILGTPAIFIDNAGRGFTQEQERLYGSVFNFTESRLDQERSITQGLNILQQENVKELWQEKRKMLLRDKIDVTAWLVDLIQNYRDRSKT